VTVTDGSGNVLGGGDFPASEGWQKLTLPLGTKPGISELRLTFSGELSDLLEIAFG
jgi:hypothetical protein